MKDRIIFLDIDGVLNTKSYRESPDVDYYNDFISDYNMRFLKHIVMTTDAKICLTSIWRTYWSPSKLQFDKSGEYINRIFERYALEIYDKTPALNNDRDAEITAYLEENGQAVKSYVIIDDFDFKWSDCNKKHLVKTDDENGLNEKTAEAAKQILLGDYTEMRYVDKEWAEVCAIIEDAVGKDIFGIYFKTLKAVCYYPDSKVLFLSCRSFFRKIIEDSENFSDVLDRAIRIIFDEDIKYVIEDAGVEDYCFTMLSCDASEGKIKPVTRITYDPFAVYDDFPDIRAQKIKEKLSRQLRRRPEHVFHSESISTELLLRTLIIFANVAETSGIREFIKVTKNGNCIEVYSKGANEFLIDRVESVKKIFLASDYNRHVIRNYTKEKRYVSAPFHVRPSVASSSSEDEFYANIDSYFTLFSLICTKKAVCIENIKDGIFSRVVYKKGIDTNGNETGVTDKENGSYISFENFHENEISSEEIIETLENIALIYTVKTIFSDPENDILLTFDYASIGTYLDKQFDLKHKSFFAKVKGSGKDRYTSNFYNATVEVGFQFSHGNGFVKSFYNFSLLPTENSALIDKLYKTVVDKLNSWLDGKTTKHRFTVHDIKYNCEIILVINTDDDGVSWEPMRAEPVNERRMISDMIEDCFNNFLYWLDDRDQVELITLIFDMFNKKDEEANENLFPDGMK